MDPRDKDRSGPGYAAAIAVSALGHAGLLYLALFALPRWFTAEETPPPVYSVKIVDSLPAGDLGSHLPKLSRRHRTIKTEPPPPEEKPPPPSEEKPPPPTAPKVEAPNEDRNAIALNNITVTPAATPAPTEAPTPTPEATATVAETPEPTARRTPAPRPTRHKRAEVRAKRLKAPSPRATPRTAIARAPSIPKALRTAIPKALHTASIKERLARVREQLMREHLKEVAKNTKNPPESDEEESDDEETNPAPAATRGKRSTGSGPVAGSVASAGRGYGIGPGTGSVGILKDPEFLLYYQKVQERIKDAWSFSSGNRELTTTVDFAIGPDGRLTGIAVAHSSHDASFDQSVLRAIRRAAPFPAPPQKYRDQFAQGIQAVFRLGELSS